MRGWTRRGQGEPLTPGGSAGRGISEDKRMRLGLGMRTTLSRDAQHTPSWGPAACVSSLDIPVLGRVEKGLNRWATASPAPSRGLPQTLGQTSGPEGLLTNDLSGFHPGALGPVCACCHL